MNKFKIFLLLFFLLSTVMGQKAYSRALSFAPGSGSSRPAKTFVLVRRYGRGDSDMMKSYKKREKKRKGRIADKKRKSLRKKQNADFNKGWWTTGGAKTAKGAAAKPSYKPKKQSFMSSMGAKLKSFKYKAKNKMNSFLSRFRNKGQSGGKMQYVDDSGQVVNVEL